MQKLETKNSPSSSGQNTPSLGEVAAKMILQSVGEDITREGLLRTPNRFAKALDEICVGYKMTAEEVVGNGIFASEGPGLVSVRNIEFYSLCEHHMLPFYGKISVAYYPREKIIGLSKIPRVVDVFAKRFQVQERITTQVGDSLFQLLNPRAIAVRATGSHMCMMMRGVGKQMSDTVSEYAKGLDKLSPSETTQLWKSLE